MAKITLEKWGLAKRMFEAGKTLGDITKETDIDKSQISKKAKSEGWIKGKNQQLIQDAVRVTAEISNLDSTDRAFVEKEVDERTRHLKFFNQLTMKNLVTMSKKIDEDMTIMEHRLAQDTIAKGKETVIGKEVDVSSSINAASLPPVINLVLNRD